jgi:hypothetical protein
MAPKDVASVHTSETSAAKADAAKSAMAMLVMYIMFDDAKVRNSMRRSEGLWEVSDRLDRLRSQREDEVQKG